jgi:hypothetical protein
MMFIEIAYLAAFTTLVLAATAEAAGVLTDLLPRRWRTF